MEGETELLVLSAAPAAELAVVTNRYTAKSQHSGARLKQLDAAAALTTAHCSSTLHSQHSTVMALGDHGACGIPRDDGDQMVLLLKCSSCLQPGTRSSFSCWAYCWLPWKFLESSCWQLN